MIELKDKKSIKEALLQLKKATIPGKSNDGDWVTVYYKAYLPPTDRQIAEARVAQKHNLDLHIYSGPLDSIIYPTKIGDFVFTILSTTRVKGDKYRYRSFNVDKGQVQRLAILNEEVKKRSWFKRLWAKVSK